MRSSHAAWSSLRCKRGREVDASFSASDVAAALQIPLLGDDVLLKAVVPALRGETRRGGAVQLQTLAMALQAVLCHSDGHQLHHILHQFAVEEIIFSPDIVHVQPDDAAVLCAALSADPWNSLCSAAACQLGNYNEVPPSLQHALQFFRGKRWDFKAAWSLVHSSQHATAAMMDFQQSPAKQRKFRRVQHAPHGAAHQLS